MIIAITGYPIYASCPVSSKLVLGCLESVLSQAQAREWIVKLLLSVVQTPALQSTPETQPKLIQILTVLQIGAMFYFDAYGHLWYPILAGAYLGLSAGFLWTTAAFMTAAYPEEKDRGFWRGLQWSSNVSGAAVGACVALGK